METPQNLTYKAIQTPDTLERSWNPKNLSIYIYIFFYTHTHAHIDRERERKGERERENPTCCAFLDRFGAGGRSHSGLAMPTRQSERV